MPMPERRISIDEWRAAVEKRRQSKYHAQPCVVDGVRFDSGAEARRFLVLQLEQKAGRITDLVRQPAFELSVFPGDASGQPIGIYRADFSYVRDGVRIVEDVKGFDTPLSRWKRRHVLAQYGIVVVLIREV